MKVSRNTANKIHFLLDNLVPPILRDSKWFMYIPFKLLFGKKSNIFFNFKEKAQTLSKHQFSRIYRCVDNVLIQRETDLNKDCFDEIMKNIQGRSVLEVGCGRCALISEISKKGYAITAVDIIITEEIKEKFPVITFMQANVNSLPFKNNTFDTVICTHTLEHVQDLFSGINELRRVCRKRLIIVVPKQRPYKYTFDLHIHFFPYKSSFLALLGEGKNTCRTIGGDIFYMEEMG